MSDNRYNETVPPDSPVVTMGDEQIIGMDARTQPERLEPGYAQFLQNMRTEALEVMVRKGMSKQTNSITPTTGPLIIPFVVGSGAMIQLVVDGIFASTVFSDPNNNNALYIFFATRTEVYAFASATGAVSTIAYPANELVELADPSTCLTQFGGSVYLDRGELGISFALTSITSSTTTATVTTVPNHGLSTNMYVRVGGAAQAPYNGDFQITVTGAKTFTYTMASNPGVSPATGTLTLNRLKTPLVWNGNFSSPFALIPYGVISQNFSYPAPANWSLLQQNRLVRDYTRNQVSYSDILNAQSEDTINGILSFNPGSNDYLVGATPYQDVQTLIFLRQSVWLVSGVNGDVAAFTSQLVTNQVGCCSRLSITTCGPNVLFLNERGVFMLQPGFELTLRGNSLPLSAPVDSIIQTINFGALNKPVAACHLNRYYLAIPVNGSTRNNAMIVYNFINEAWESYDTFPNGFFCDQMQVMLNASGIPTLYVISFEGGLYAYEQNEMDDFAAAANPATQYLINGLFTTRRFNFGSSGLKRFSRVTTVADMDANSSLATTATLINPESSRSLSVITSVTGGQVTRPQFINKRAYALELNYSNTANRCSITNFQIGAILQDQKSIAQN